MNRLIKRIKRLGFGFRNSKTPDVTCALIAPDALAGNVKAVMALLRIMNARCPAAWTA